MHIDNLVAIAGLLIGVAGFYLSMKEFRKSNLLKRAEFLEKLIEEFNRPDKYLALKILDDFWVGAGNQETSAPMTDNELVENGSKEAIEKERLSHYVQNMLRDHRK